MSILLLCAERIIEIIILQTIISVIAWLCECKTNQECYILYYRKFAINPFTPKSLDLVGAN